MQRGVKVFGADEAIPAQWDERVARRVLATFEQSGMTGAAFGRSRGFNPAKMFFWRKRLERRAGAESEAGVASAFVELSAPSGTRVVATPVPSAGHGTSGPTQAESLQIVCERGGMLTIRVFGVPDAAALRAVFAAIGDAP